MLIFGGAVALVVWLSAFLLLREGGDPGSPAAALPPESAVPPAAPPSAPEDAPEQGVPAEPPRSEPAEPTAGTPVPVSVVRDVPGLYDGIAVEEEEDLFGRESDWLYFSDWAANGRPGAVKKMNLRTREVKDAVSVPVNGPADFIVEDGKIYLPAMLDKKVVVE